MSDDSTLTLNNFSISQSMTSVDLILMWQGEMTLRDPGVQLTPFLDRCIAQSESRRIVMDFTRVTFMNSSSLVPILAFIKKLGAEGRALELRYNEAIGWQRVSYQSMTILCKKVPLVKICYAGKASSS